MGIYNLDNQYFGLDLQKINTSCKKLMLYFDKPNKVTSHPILHGILKLKYVWQLKNIDQLMK